MVSDDRRDRRVLHCDDDLYHRPSGENLHILQKLKENIWSALQKRGAIDSKQVVNRKLCASKEAALGEEETVVAAGTRKRRQTNKKFRIQIVPLSIGSQIMTKNFTLLGLAG